MQNCSCFEFSTGMKIGLILQIICVGLMTRWKPSTGTYFDAFYGKYSISNPRATFMAKRRTPIAFAYLNDRQFVSGSSRQPYHSEFGIAVRPGAHRSLFRSKLAKSHSGCKDPCRDVNCGAGMRCRLVDIPCLSSSCNTLVQPSCVQNVKPVQVNEVNQCNIGEPVLSFSSVIKEMNCTVGNKTSCPANCSCEVPLYNGLPKCCYVQDGCMVRKMKTRTASSTVHEGVNKLCPDRKSLLECRQDCKSFRDCRYNEICCPNSCGLNQCVRSRWGSVITKQHQAPTSKRFPSLNLYTRNAIYYSKLSPGTIKGFAQPIPFR